ncbi:MAG TPA: multicopper oxidase domain-containing protein [Methylomirabilota bacterium]|nr:multicopper oxidase domain-containing protein [Methylomirabilota bacterium]
MATACNASPPPTDPYDQGKMDFKPGPARVSAERRTGAFTEGSSLSLGAELKPLDPAPVKTVRLDTTHKIIEIAPGVKFQAWTFGDQVPGPTIRARVGDRIRFRMTNRSDEPMPAAKLTTAPLMHSMDFHAAMVSPQDKYRSIAPGQTIEFEFTLNYPGVFMYHCGTPMILEHIASGMYGAVVVEPRQGYPTKVSREYVIVQSEFYARPDPGKRRVDNAPLYVLDGDRLRAAQPTHTVFNGVHNGMVKTPLPAQPGERVRLHVLNVGPSKTSSFHVVGTIFDRVWFEGNPDNQFRGMQTVLLGSSNSATVEFVIPEAGSYIMVDHHFANASQGAIGLISTQVKGPAADLEHHNIPASATPTDPDAVAGKLNFESKCLACHSVGEGKKLGPDVAGVTRRRNDAWLTRWLKDPAKMLDTDPDAQAMLKEYNNLPMPNQSLSDTEIRQFIKYFHWIDAQPPGAARAAGAH